MVVGRAKVLAACEFLGTCSQRARYSPQTQRHGLSSGIAQSMHF